MKELLNSTLAKIRPLYFKDTIKKMKRQAPEWEKMLVNHTSDKVFVSRIYKELKQLNNNKTKTQFLKLGRDLNRRFAKENIQMAK